MTIDSKEVVARLCRAAAGSRYPLGAVRTQKLVYLMECEFYRWEQSRLTDERWIYYYYGPWSPTLDQLLRNNFKITPELLSDGRQINSVTYSESEFFKLPERFADVTIQGIFQTIVEKWLTRPLNELLDFVYFHTAPMANARRRDVLDFRSIVPAKDEYDPINVYKLADKQRGRKEKVKKALAAWLSEPTVAKIIPGPVDAAMIEAIGLINDAEATPKIEGNISIGGEDVSRLSGD